MPIIIPILGATDAPAESVRYESALAVRVVSNFLDLAEQTLDALSATAVETSSTIGPKAEGKTPIEATITPSSFEQSEVSRTMQPVAGDTFLIFVDLLNAKLTNDALAGAGGDEDDDEANNSPITNINARLTVNGMVLTVKSFSWEVPTGRLGGILNCVLQTPNLDQLPNDCDVKFDLIVLPPTGPEIVYNLLDSGKMQQRSLVVSINPGKMGGPADEVSFGAIDVIADLFSRGPRQPVIMFDPNRVKFDEVDKETQDGLYEETTGNLIMPILEPVAGLTSKMILRRAYTEAGGSMFITPQEDFPSWGDLIGTTDQVGVGFTQIVTNLPDFPVRRADFTIEGGWHNGAQPCIAMYSPLYFTSGETLFIIDPDRPIPYGTTAHKIRLSDHKQLSLKTDFPEYNNAVILTYQFDYGSFVQRRDKYYETVDEQGTPGAAGYSKAVTRKWMYEYYRSSEPSETIGTNLHQVDIETFQTVFYHVKNEDGSVTTTNIGVQLTHKETTDYIYSHEMLRSSTKITKALILVGPLANPMVQEVEQEYTSIAWKDDPYNPGVKLQSRVNIDTSGKIAFLTDAETVGGLEIVRGFPLLMAQRNGWLKSETRVSATYQPIKTSRETLQRVNGKQFIVNVVETDHQNGTVLRSSHEPATGSTMVDQYESRSKSILIRDVPKENAVGYRIPISINSYELPRAEALAFAKNVLYRLTNPLDVMPLDLPDVDFGVQQGSVVRGQLRDGGYTPNFFVTGYAIHGTGLGVPGQHRINMSIEAAEMIEQLIPAEPED